MSLKVCRTHEKISLRNTIIAVLFPPLFLINDNYIAILPKACRSHEKTNPLMCLQMHSKRNYFHPNSRMKVHSEANVNLKNYIDGSQVQCYMQRLY